MDKIIKQITFGNTNTAQPKLKINTLIGGSNQRNDDNSSISTLMPLIRLICLLVVKLLAPVLLLLLLGVHDVGTADAVEDEREKAKRKS